MLKKISNWLLKNSPWIFLSIGFLLLSLTYYQSALAELRYNLDLAWGKVYKVETSRNIQKPTQQENDFHNLTNAAKEIVIEPISSQFGIVVEKLGINAPVVKDVPVIDKTAYLESLKQGVAHASFSGYPDGENSNVYLFAHSSNNFWELGKYSSVFNLIYKLNPGDQINIFYKDKRYLYAVDNKILINDFKVDETVYESIGPTLTLQTCYPTGTSLYRLIVRSSLIGIYDFK